MTEKLSPKSGDREIVTIIESPPSILDPNESQGLFFSSLLSGFFDRFFGGGFFGAWCGGTGVGHDGGGGLFFGAGFEFEADFTGGGVEREVSVELAFSAVRYETTEQVGFAGGEELGELVGGDIAL